jgi:hypothetical protein
MSQCLVSVSGSEKFSVQRVRSGCCAEAKGWRTVRNRRMGAKMRFIGGSRLGLGLS